MSWARKRRGFIAGAILLLAVGYGCGWFGNILFRYLVGALGAGAGIDLAAQAVARKRAERKAP